MKKGLLILIAVLGAMQFDIGAKNDVPKEINEAFDKLWTAWEGELLDLTSELISVNKDVTLIIQEAKKNPEVLEQYLYFLGIVLNNILFQKKRQRVWK